MNGDKHHVHYTKFSEPGTHTEPNGPWDTWRDAKIVRDGTFRSFPDVQSCWIMVTNDVYGLRPKKFGETLKRGSKRRYDSDTGKYHTSPRR